MGGTRDGREPLQSHRSQMSDEKQELHDLVLSPGWLRLCEHARLEWRDGYPQKMKLARMNAKAEGEDAGVAMDKVDAASDAVNALLSWPKERIAAIESRHERDHAEPAISRRGSGL